MAALGNVPGRRSDALGQVTSTLYDALGNVTNVTGATYPVSYGYDDWNRMVWMKTYRDENGAGDLTQWQYDLATGLVTNKVYADGKGTAYAYTADGKLARRTWARGVTTDYGYTPAGELETVNYSDATPDVGYNYDRLGRPVTIADVTGTRTNVYDVATLALAQEKLANGLTLTRSQDALGRSAGISMPDYSVEYGYDSFGRFGSVTSSVSVVNYSYVPGSDLLEGYTQGNLTREVTYETSRDLVDTVENKYGTTTVSKFDYTNDTLGRRMNREDTGSAFASAQENVFGYNLRSEVTGAEMRNGNSSYTYDPIGNRTTVTLPDEQNPLVYAANPLNQYTSITGRTAPAYDFDGNMTDDGAGLGMAWDGENRLIQTVKNGQTVSYAYDFMSRRVSKNVGGTTHGYVYDGWNLIFETDGTTVKRYVWGLDLSQTLQGAGGVGGLLACSSGAQPPEVYAPTYDANGNISEYIVLADGAIASHREYDAFGRVILSTGTAPSAFWFSTKYTDAETGLVYYGYRYYSAGLGRWVGRDMIEEMGAIGLNVFLGNSPISSPDILGLQSLWDPTPPMPESGDIISDPWRLVMETEAQIIGTLKFDQKQPEVAYSESGCPCVRRKFCQRYIAVADIKRTIRSYERWVREYDIDSSLPPAIPDPRPLEWKKKDLKFWLLAELYAFDRYVVANSYTEYYEHKLVKIIKYRNFRWTRDGEMFECGIPEIISNGPCDHDRIVVNKMPPEFEYTFNKLPADPDMEVIKEWVSETMVRRPF